MVSRGLPRKMLLNCIISAIFILKTAEIIIYEVIVPLWARPCGWINLLPGCCIAMAELNKLVFKHLYPADFLFIYFLTWGNVLEAREAACSSKQWLCPVFEKLGSNLFWKFPQTSFFLAYVWKNFSFLFFGECWNKLFCIISQGLFNLPKIELLFLGFHGNPK